MAMVGISSPFPQMVTCNPTVDYVNQFNSGTNWFKYDIVAAMISSISLLLVASLILFDFRLQTHPNRMVAIICLCDSYLFFQFASRYLICGLGWSPDMNWLYAVTV